MNQIEINGVTYNIISEVTIKAGRVELKMKRPNGRRFYFVVKYENGAMSEVV